MKEIATRKARLLAVQTLVLVMLFGAWEAASQLELVSQRVLPAPSDIAGSLLTGVQEGTLVEHGLISLRRFATGVLLALVVGVVVGLVLGMSQLLRAALYPLLKFAYPIPVAAFIPVVLVITGIRDSLYITVIVIAAGIPIVIATIDAVRRVDPVLLESGRTLGASPFRLFLKVLFPAVLPRVLDAAYVAFALGLIVLTTAEILVSTQGLGSVLVLAQRQFRVADMFAGIVLIGIIGMVQGAVVRWAGERLTGWESGYLRKQW